MKYLNSAKAQVVVSGTVSIFLIVLATVFGLYAFNQATIANNLLNQITLHRADVFRLSELSRRLDSSQPNNLKPEEAIDALVQQISDAVKLFDKRQLGFRKGSEELEFMAIENMLLLATLDEISKIWGSLRTQLLDHTEVHKQIVAGESHIFEPSSEVNQLFVQVDRLQRGVSADSARMQEQTMVILAMIIGLVILSIGFIGLIFMRIIRDLSTLQQTTQYFARGNFHKRVATNTFVELADVGVVLNQMAESVLEREQDLKDANQSLEQQIEERTSDLRLARDEALTAQKDALEGSRLKSEFISTMSHELRTPLNAIIGYCGLLDMGITGKIDEGAKETIASIQESGEHLLSLINDVLDIAKIEAGQMEIVEKSVSLVSMIKIWKRHISVLAEDKGLEFEITIDPKLPDKIYGDANRLTQIVNNLLSNAVKFADSGNVSLHIKQDNDTWLLQVSDTGTGIPLEAQDYIFDRFRQVDGTAQRAHGGTGLGLAITQKIIQAMMGSIVLESTLGKGSIFTVILPLKIVETQIPDV